MEFVVPVGHRVKQKESEHECDGNTNCNWNARYGHQKIDYGTGRLGNNRTNRDHLNYSIIEIGLNTEKSPGDLRRLAVTQTPVKTISSRWCEKLSKK